MMISVFDRVENVVGNGENAGYQHFLLENAGYTVGKGEKCCLPAFSTFPTMFSRSIFLRVMKTWDCVVKD